MSQYWSKLVNQLSPYEPGEQPKLNNIIKLNTNENPYPPSPKALSAIAHATNESLRLYPDPESTELKTTMASMQGLSADNVFVGNGSDEVLAHAFVALLKHDKAILFPDITYSFYPVYCGLYDIEFTKIPLTAEFSVNPEDYNAPNGGIIIPNPNAPTGRAMSIQEIRSLLDQNAESVVIIDEAYIDFGGESAAKLIPEYDNLLVVQTLSKSYSLAGLRVGFALGNAVLIQALDRVKNSFNSYPIDRCAQAGAKAALEDEAYFNSCCKKIIATRKACEEKLLALNFEIVPSTANFIFVTHKSMKAADIFAKLRQKNIIVRYFDKPRISNYLRITIGTDEEMSMLTSALEEIVGR